MKKLTLIDKAFLLAKTPMFQALDLDLLLPIADKLGIVTYEAGEIIFNINEDAHRMYLIVSGEIEILGEVGAIVEVLGHEDFFGDESMFNDKARSYAARSRTDVTLLTLSQTHLLTVISECPSVALGFLQMYSSGRVRK